MVQLVDTPVDYRTAKKIPRLIGCTSSACMLLLYEVLATNPPLSLVLRVAVGTYCWFQSVSCSESNYDRQTDLISGSVRLYSCIPEVSYLMSEDPNRPSDIRLSGKDN